MTHTPANPSRSWAERIVSATAAIAVAYAAAKLMGFVQARVIGHYYGFSGVNDVFVATFGLLNSIFLIGEESLAPGYLPVFRQAKEEDGEERAWLFSSTLLNLYFLVVLLAVVLLVSFPAEAVKILTRFRYAEDGAGGDISRAALAAHFLRGMAPALLGLSVGSVTYTMLVGYKRFFWPAIAEAGLKAALVAAVLFGRRLGLGDDALIAGVLAAGVTKIAIHLLALGGKLRHWRPALQLTSPRFKRFFILVAPLLAGILFAKLRDLFNYIYVLSELKQEGYLAINSYGRQMYTAVGWIVPYPLSIAMLPFLVDMVAKEDAKSVGQFLTRACRMLLVVFVPLAAVLAVLAPALAQFFYQTGKVTAADAARVGQVSAVYTAVIPFYALEMVFMQAYFSTHRTLSVTIIGLIFSALSMVASYMGVVQYGLNGLPAVLCVASSFTATKALKCVTLVSYLKLKALPLMPLKPTLGFLARLLPMAAACAAAAWGVYAVVERALPTGQAALSGSAAMLRAVPKLAPPGLAALIVFFLGCKLLRLSELDEMVAFTKEKLRRK